MKVKTKDLDGIYLNCVIAKLDKALEGTTLGVVNGVMCVIGNTDANRGKPLSMIGPLHCHRVDEAVRRTGLRAIYAPSHDLAAGSRITGREGIFNDITDGKIVGFVPTGDNKRDCVQEGPTLNVAALRSLVEFKLGEEVDLPD